MRSWKLWVWLVLVPCLVIGCASDDDDSAPADASDVTDMTDASDATDATDTSDPSESQVVADPVPLTFELCTETNPGEGACVCATEPGFQTYRAVQGNTERCFTIYGNPNWGDEPRPLLIEPDCYSNNQPPGGAFQNDRYGIAHCTLPRQTGAGNFRSMAWSTPRMRGLNATRAARVKSTTSRPPSNWSNRWFRMAWYWPIRSLCRASVKTRCSLFFRRPVFPTR